MELGEALGVAGDPTDFGETLHVWGAPEGEYAEVPFIGPTTGRDTLGLVVDVALNPVRLVLPNDTATQPLLLEPLEALRLPTRHRMGCW